MIDNAFILAIIQAGTTGAGLIFAAYGITVSFSEQIKKFREKRNKEARNRINKTKSPKELKKIAGDIESSESTPLYLTRFVIVSFLLYLLSVILGIFYISSSNPTNNLGLAVITLFSIATVSFGLIGLTLLNDFLDLMKDYLNRGKKR